MRRALDPRLVARLRRIAALVETRRPALDRERAARAARRIVVTAVRAGLTRAGIDPDEAVALQHAMRPDPPPRPPAIDRSGPIGVLAERLAALVARQREGPRPSVAGASLAMLYATYCLAPTAAPAPG